MEYIGADLFLLFYLNGIVIIISGEVVLLMYPRLGLKYTIIIA